MHTEVLIVGAGPTELTLGYELYRSDAIFALTVMRDVREKQSQRERSNFMKIL